MTQDQLRQQAGNPKCPRCASARVYEVDDADRRWECGPCGLTFWLCFGVRVVTGPHLAPGQAHFLSDEKLVELAAVLQHGNPPGSGELGGAK